ncbi:MAG: hypothetical protein QM676_15445 [Novosphingobium sp.]
MSRLATSFVLGYHGCDKETAEQVITGKTFLVPSDKPYDWLGPGIYFWESDPHRALEWARERCAERGGEPAVIGAAIDLGYCLDLMSRTGQTLVRDAYATLRDLYEKAERPLPENENSRRGGDFDRRLRKLDCAVIQQLHDEAADAPFDTVRGMFTEGEPIYPGAGYYSSSHVQIAVRNRSCIKGLFLAPDDLDID